MSAPTPTVPGPVIGMVHLHALPGSPRWAGSMAGVVRAAIDDAAAWAAAGADALLVENHGDVPFTPDRVDTASVAAMAVAVAEVRRAVALPVGVNVLKSDALSALAVAAATGAAFVRVNVHVGAVVTDQGIIQARAHETLRYRRALGVDVKILADVQAKHGLPLAPVPLELEARDCVSRGLADALVVSGPATGQPTAIADIERVSAAVPGVPILVGSGVTPDTVAPLLAVADALIVGTWVKRDGRLENAVDPGRARRIVEAARAARQQRC
ncbi:MAG TPA: BtpA/SgcQ family protein [Candidatus Binatia bacterium]|nr:BtpA/SgcQ family protein [Candidatus Binatia bacterium]